MTDEFQPIDEVLAKANQLVPAEPHPHDDVALPDLLKRAATKGFLPAAPYQPKGLDDPEGLVPVHGGSRMLPAEVQASTLVCFGCDQPYTPLTFRDHPAFGGARLCPDCRSGKNKVMESWTLEEEAEAMDHDDFLAKQDPAARALTPLQATQRALAIMVLEMGRLAPERARNLLVGYEEFADPEVRALLERPREFLDALMGRGSMPEGPKDVEAAVRNPEPPGLLDAPPGPGPTEG